MDYPPGHGIETHDALFMELHVTSQRCCGKTLPLMLAARQAPAVLR
jgi:hypothetical protein